MSDGSTAIVESPLKATATLIAGYTKNLLNDKRAQQFAAQLSLMAKNQPKLASCTQESLLAAMMACVHLDLMPNTPEGYAFIIPYSNSRMNKMEAQFQVGYKGMIELAYRSNKITMIEAGLVFPQDEFEYSIGEHETFTLKPDLSIDRTKLDDATAVYAIAKLDNGEKAYAVMVKQEIEKIRANVRAKSTDSPWNTWPEMQAKKTVVKRLLKYLPSSTMDNRFKMAAEYDSWAEAGKLRVDEQGNLVQREQIKLPEPVDAEQLKNEADEIAANLLAQESSSGA
jgi:recombination protein RecT